MGLNLSTFIRKISGRSGLSIKRIRRRSNMAVLWSAEEYIYQSGTLLSGVFLSNLTNDGSTLHCGIGADNHESVDTQAAVQNIDFTNYSKMDIVLNYNAGANYGSGTVAYGIDSYWTTALPGSYDWTSTTITIDISAYAGTHYIGFGLAAENNSSEPTWGAWANIQIAQIRLYN